MIKVLSSLLVFILTPLMVSAIPFEGHQMVFSGPSPIAAQISKEIAEKGGNVIDVAVATGFSLSVTSPYFAALGGGGFALIKMNKKVEVLDFREIAPLAMHPKYYTQGKKSSRQGGSAVGVPGFPAGLWAMHQKHGKMPWKELLKPAIDLAENGFRVSGEWAARTRKNEKRFSKAGKKYLFKNGKPLKPGEILKQKELAQALRKIAEEGSKAFYQGSIAKDIAQSVQNSEGDMTIEDLGNYQVKWRKPIQTEFAKHKIYLMPPPSSGGLIIQAALQLIDEIGLQKYQTLSVQELHLMGEVMARTFRMRSKLGDPDFHTNPKVLISNKAALKKLAKTISLPQKKTLPPLSEQKIKESNETTHYSILDKNGNAIAITITLNGNYGSGVVTSKYGIALNNEMDDFTTRPGEPNMFGLVQGLGNVVQAGKRPLSSMSPTLVEKNGKIVIALGAPGGPRIINGVLSVLYRILISGMDIDRAIQTPRVHHQFLPDVLFVDGLLTDGKSGPRFPPETIKALEEKGHKTKASWMARVYGVSLQDDGILQGAFDSRGEGGVGGF